MAQQEISPRVKFQQYMATLDLMEESGQDEADPDMYHEVATQAGIEFRKWRRSQKTQRVRETV